MAEPPTFSRSDYDKQLADFESVLLAAMKISTTLGGIYTTWRNIRATQLYTRMTISSFTFTSLLPGSRRHPRRDEFWDWPSVASVARNIIEAYLLYFYTGIDQIPEEEARFRLELFTYHINSEKYRLYSDWKAGQDVLRPFEDGLPRSREALKAHPFFNSLTQPQRDRAISGKSPTYLSRDELIARLPFDGSELKPFYRFLSNQTHTTPFSFFSQSNQRGRGEENEAERGYILFATRLVWKYLSAAAIGTERMFPDHYATTKDAELLNALATAKSALDQAIKGDEIGRAHV